MRVRQASSKHRDALALCAATVLIAGCDSGVTDNELRPQPNPSPGVISSPIPTADVPHGIFGTVLDAYAGLLPDTRLHLFIVAPQWGRGADASTDDRGRFSIYVPDSIVHIHAEKTGFVQPCAVRHEVRGPIDTQVELVSSTTLASFNPPRPQFATGPSLTGVIHEVANGARSPVAGAEVRVEVYDDLPIATTQSDLGGGYFVCNLPHPVMIYVSKPGYALASVVVDPAQTVARDIELKRL
jgi:hypothetical protein